MLRIGSIRTRQRLSLTFLRIIDALPLSKRITKAAFSYSKDIPPTEVFGLTFSNPLGIAAGFDPNGEYINPLSLTGCSFIEIGSITPEKEDSPLTHNIRIKPKERMVIPEHHINNKGVVEVIKNLRKESPKIIVAANITKNSTTPQSNAVKDYEKCFALLNGLVDMFVINLTGITPAEMHDMQDIEYLSEILDRLLSLRLYLDDFTPILIKVSDKIPMSHLSDILDYSMRNGIDGVIVRADSYDATLHLVRTIHEKTSGNFPIIASGGLSTPNQARELLNAGATLLELYSAFFYEGGSIVRRILKGLFPSNRQS